MFVWTPASTSCLAQRVQSEGAFKTDMRPEDLFCQVREWVGEGEVKGGTARGWAPSHPDPTVKCTELATCSGACVSLCPQWHTQQALMRGSQTSRGGRCPAVDGALGRVSARQTGLMASGDSRGRE